MPQNVLNDEILAAVDKELQPMDELAKGSGALRNSKRVTFWIGGDKEPRSAVERMVKILEDVRACLVQRCTATATLAPAAAPPCSVL